MASEFNKFDLSEEDRIFGFLEEYKKLCDKWGALVISEGEAIEVVTHDEPHKYCGRGGYWGIEDETIRRRNE